MAIETDITKLVFNKMSQEKYEELKANGELVNNEFYITPDSNIDIDIDIPENVVEADNYVNAKLWKGTLAEYKALESYDDSVTYIITDDVVEGGTIIDIDAYTKSETDELLNAKQEVLVSGTNIKTINGESILGEGDYVIDVDTSEIENNINTLNNELTTVKTDLNNKLDTSQITNCITEIPQDIKLELVDGILTLKAGSKVYVSNGAGKFDKVVIESDKTASYGHDTSDIVWYHGNGIDLLPINLVYSGSTAPSGNQYMMWYDTTNNQIKYTNNSGASWSAEQSLPLGVIATSSSAPTSIDQVFNGFGYIGATTFALPGIKFLTPNGRNEDGTLNNIERITEQVIINNYTYQTTNHQQWFISHNGQFRNAYYYEQDEEPTLTGASVWYSPSRNKMYWCNAIEDGWKHITTVTMAADKINNDSNFNITSIDFKKPFTAIDKNETFWLSGLAMPSDKYIDLNLGASGTTYTAPANGYFVLNKLTSSIDQYANFVNQTNGMNTTLSFPSTSANIRIYMPVLKGHIVSCSYSAGGTTEMFRFIYAQGEK